MNPMDLLVALPEDVTTHAAIGPRPRSIGAIMAGFKAAVTKRINVRRGTPGVFVWQRNYHEHIIRNDAELARIQRYIQENPQQWSLDRENPTVHAVVNDEPWAGRS
jgi:putative transposase